MRQQVYAKKGFAEACWKCQGPMKPEWKRCPGCKAAPGGQQEAESKAQAAAAAALSGAGAALGRVKSRIASVVSQPKTTEQSVKEFVTCASCAAPCKAKWKECPACKTPQKGLQSTKAPKGVVKLTSEGRS